MRIREMYQGDRCGVSFEIFPPKSADGDESLLRALERLAPYAPAFISCTYGAGGTTRTRTIDWCSTIQTRFGLTATSHFTCLGGSIPEIEEWLDLAIKNDIRNIMALRGDPPVGETAFRPAPGGFHYANELVAHIRRRHPDIGIGVAGYPEKHQECPDCETDLANLKRKVEAGADAVFTQLFYSNESFFNFRDRYQRLGIKVPLIPGIMPITEFSRIKRITSMCGATIPTELGSRLEAAQHDPQTQFEVGVAHAVRQCDDLLRAGVPGIHFYVLNRSTACETILDQLGMAPTREFNLS
jgi:methylenetetrahydrofolate reductase (NADPH)